MELSTLDQMLKATLEDEKFTRNERQALSQVIAEESPDFRALSLYRHRAFALAKEHLGQRDGVLEWLEDVVKLMTPTAPPRKVESHAYFTPGDDCAARIVDMIHQAKSTLDICVFTITYDQIARAIFEAHQRGVAVRVITDEDKSRDVGSDIDRLIREGVPVRLESTDHHMHHKFAIFDDDTLLNGSYNWTRSAAIHNQENILITNDPSLCKEFYGEFQRLWDAFQ